MEEKASSGPAAQKQSVLYTGSRIELYTSTSSVEAGETVVIHVSTTASRYELAITRVGAEEVTIWTQTGLPGSFHPSPDDAWEKGCRWPPSVSITIPDDWKSGYYQVKAVTCDDGGTAGEYLAFFVVRAAKPAASILIVLATNTYQAYNAYGGASFYRKRNPGEQDADAGLAGPVGEHKLSFLRPMTPGFLWKPSSYDLHAEVNSGNYDLGHVLRPHKTSGIPYIACAAGFHNWERVMIEWLERNGFAVDYAVNSDLEMRPALIDRYRLMLSVGHDEYWSSGMRDNVESFISRGGNVCFFSGNVSFWQVRYEDNGTSLVCFKDDFREDPVFIAGDRHLATGLWSNHHIGRPESRMTGLSTLFAGFHRFLGHSPSGSGGYQIYRPEHWIFEKTGLTYGDCLGTESRIVHYETDGAPVTLERGLPCPADFHDGPSSLEILGMAPASFGGSAALAEETFGPNNPKAAAYVTADRGHAMMSIYSNNGTVFSAGTTDWTNGLTGKDPAVEQITRNLLARLAG